MATYLMKFKYTAETWKALLDDPADRTEPIAGAVRKLGGELKGFWLAFGEYDGYLLVESPEPLTPAALAMLDVGGGFVSSMETTVLLGIGEAVEAMKKAKSLLSGS
jgi:uncharacterized protein with GYD domain